MQNISSKQIILIAGGVCIIGGIVLFSVYVVKNNSLESEAPIVSTTTANLSGFILANPDIIPQMSAPTSTNGVAGGTGLNPTAIPGLSPQEMQAIKKSSSVFPEIKRPVRTAEQQKLLDFMSVQ